ncbi:MAG TPA: response regulator [Aggregatilineales bacterium]|nr:response regulator [Aggregatilineales bacterium]
MTEKKISALVIEDDADAAFISQKAMTDNGYDVTVITRGDEAAEQLKVLTPDVILLDLHLPNVAGIDLLKQIRSSEHLADTRVVLVTADPRTAQTLEHDADMTLLKPVTYSQVRGLVGRLLKKIQ